MSSVFRIVGEKRQEAGGRRQEAVPMKKFFHHPTMHENPSRPVSASGASLSSQTPMNFHLTTTDENLFVSASGASGASGASIFRLGGKEICWGS
ncbi:MAG: hypothetical protein F6K41_23980 [Symploca sp. SIO3E6]|nr:hypothetical protein [Caldora sp. SIO3E6]